MLGGDTALSDVESRLTGLRRDDFCWRLSRELLRLGEGDDDLELNDISFVSDCESSLLNDDDDVQT